MTLTGLNRGGIVERGNERLTKGPVVLEVCIIYCTFVIALILLGTPYYVHDLLSLIENFGIR